MLLKLPILLLMMGFCSSLFPQTCIVAKKTKNAVYVGADSREQIFYFNPTTRQFESRSVDTACKISNFGSFHAAAAGYGSPYLLDYLVSKSKNIESFKELIYAFNQNLSKDFGKYLEWMRTNHEDSYRRHAIPNKILTEILIFGFEKDSCVLMLGEFGVSNNMEQPINVIGFIANVDDSVRAIGHREEIDL